MAIVFLTGATGFVGGAVLASLLEDSRVEQVIALVRAEDEHHARERLAASLRRFQALPKRTRVLTGSLSAFEIPAATRAQITHVIHCAAHTSFRSVRTARETNVEGTRHLAATFSGAPKLERFLFVGTAYRLGLAPITGVVDEDQLSSDDHLVEYTRTKAEAEAVIEALPGFPAIIARPSIVIGHTTLGVGPSASLFWYYRALAAAGASPFHDERLRDIVPVDWVATALTELLFKPVLHHTRYHLSAGVNSAVSWGAIRELFAPGTHSHPVALAGLEAHPAWRVAGFDDWTVGAIAACAKFSALPYDVFSNLRVLAEGIAPPPPFTRYLARCIESSDRSIAAQARDDV